MAAMKSVSLLAEGFGVASLLAVTDWNPLIVAISVSIPTIAGLVAAYIDLRRKMLEQAKAMEKNTEDLKHVAASVTKVEKQTDGIHDALMKKTEEEARQRGVLEERDRAAVEKAAVVLGIEEKRVVDEERGVPIPTKDPIEVILKTSHVKDEGEKVVTTEDLADALAKDKKK